jgi:hypothetical protein
MRLKIVIVLLLLIHPSFQQTGLPVWADVNNHPSTSSGCSQSATNSAGVYGCTLCHSATDIFFEIPEWGLTNYGAEYNYYRICASSSDAFALQLKRTGSESLKYHPYFYSSLSGKPIYKLCKGECRTCSSEFVCTTCFYSLNSAAFESSTGTFQSCIQLPATNIVGYYLKLPSNPDTDDGGTYRQCNNCQFCDSTGCLGCSANNYYLRDTTDCCGVSPTCTGNLYLDNSNPRRWRDCKPNCRVCTSASDCSSCVSNYLLYTSAQTCISINDMSTLIDSSLGRGYYTTDNAVALICPSHCLYCEYISGFVSCTKCPSSQLKFSSNNNNIFDKCILSTYLSAPSDQNVDSNGIQRGFYTASNTADVTGAGVALRCANPCITCNGASGSNCVKCPSRELRYTTNNDGVYDRCIEEKYLSEGSSDNQNRGYYTEVSAPDTTTGTVIGKKCPSPCKLCSYVNSAVSCDLCFPNYLKFTSVNNSVYDKCIHRDYLSTPSPDNTYDNVKFHGFYTLDSENNILSGSTIALRCNIKCRTCETNPFYCKSCFNGRPIF